LFLGGRIGNGLGNDGDVLDLLDPSGSILDAVSWGDDITAFDPPVDDVPEGHSIERRTPGADSDRAADFVDNHRPSPGAAFVAATSDDEQPHISPATRVLDGAGETSWRWVPWALAATSAAAFAALVAWRTFDVLRGRPRVP
jgi:hypothetical protein